MPLWVEKAAASRLASPAAALRAPRTNHGACNLDGGGHMLLWRARIRFGLIGVFTLSPGMVRVGKAG